MECTKIIPSHKRAGSVTTTRVVSGCILCVAESQAQDYAAMNPGTEIVTHPDDVIGINAKRQWILDRWGSGPLMMLDDDILSFRRMYRPPDRDYPRKSTVPPDLVSEIIDRAAETCAEFGAKLFGFASHCNPQTYQPLRPFGLGGYIPGGCIGFLVGHGLHFPAEVTFPGCDYWICALNAHLNRIAWIDRRYAFEFRKTYDNPGGMAEFRGGDGEERGREWLVEMFGSSVIGIPQKTPWTKNKKNSAGRALRLPWHV
jgi:hypothetical protein